MGKSVRLGDMSDSVINHVNDIILVELRKAIRFEPKERRLRYIGYIINLIAKAYLYG